MSEMWNAFRLGFGVAGDQTLADVLEQRGVHPLRQFTVLKFVATWGLVTETLGREPHSYGEFIRVSQVKPRTGWAWLAAFREAFPEFDSPAPLWAGVRDRVAGTKSVTGLAAQLASLRLGAA